MYRRFDMEKTGKETTLEASRVVSLGLTAV
jgi:hypothetical protein